jgi:AcrR family transcriptional regulator
MVKNSQDPGPALAAALELLIRQGYNSTPVEELADAAGISRSTFFRKFGSKEDMVFADHERLLARVESDLASATGDPLAAVAEAALMVFDQHVRNRETSLLRNRLLHQVQSLRDRELVTTHRYERSFRRHLQSALPEAGGEYGAVAFAAAVVAVHNRVLRHWLQDAERGSDDRLDHAMASRLGRELRSLVSIFRPVLFPPAVPELPRPAVVVTVLDPGAGPEQILEAVREALP